MSRRTRHRLVLAATVLGVLAGTMAALPTTAAATVAPANDSIRHASVISDLPASFSQSTRGATAGRYDGRCVQGASVWYRFTPERTVTGRVVTIGSNYDTVLAVFRGPRADRTLLRCNDDRL